MLAMRPLRALGSSFRTVIAVLFGFTSLAHGPVTAFAQEHAPHAHHQPVAHHAAQHVEHTNHPEMQMAADQGYRHHATDSICYASGCFVAVAPFLVGAPISIASPLQQLGPAVARAIVAADIDPSDPPPRLQV